MRSNQFFLQLCISTSCILDRARETRPCLSIPNFRNSVSKNLTSVIQNALFATCFREYSRSRDGVIERTSVVMEHRIFIERSPEWESLLAETKPQTKAAV